MDQERSTRLTFTLQAWPILSLGAPTEALQRQSTLSSEATDFNWNSSALAEFISHRSSPTIHILP